MITLNQLTDTQLVVIYQKNNDPVYFGELYNRYYQKLYNFCLGKVKNRDTAYDVTADTFIKLAEKIGALKNPELFIAWLFRIAHNACMDTFRNAKNTFSTDSNSFFDLADDISGLENLMMHEAQLGMLDQVLNQVDLETKTLLVSKYFEGKSIEDLQKDMGLSKSAVKMRLARGRNKIAEIWPRELAF